MVYGLRICMLLIVLYFDRVVILYASILFYLLQCLTIKCSIFWYLLTIIICYNFGNSNILCIFTVLIMARETRYFNTI